jgi:Cytochrome P460
MKFNNTLASAASTLFIFSWIVGSIASGETAEPGPGAHYAGDKLLLPENYREWVYLSTGFDMSYSALAPPGHHMFDNVFVEPGAYKAFLATGTWPDKTMLVLETRGATGKGSINQHGNYQGTEVMGTEVHIKDTTRFEGGWAFFSFDEGRQASMIPHNEDCYSCHLAHAAVDTTFVQFYPTLLPLAKAKGTLSRSYQP